MSDEAFTQLVSGITGYMSQAAMGQAPRQTIADFLSGLGDTYNIPQGGGTAGFIIIAVTECSVFQYNKMYWLTYHN